MEQINDNGSDKSMQLLIHGQKVRLTFAQQCNTVVPVLIKSTLLDSFARQQAGMNKAN